MSETSRRDFLATAFGAATAIVLGPEQLFARPATRAPHRVAVIGIGRQGRAIMDELLKIEGIEIAAVCDVIPARLAAAAERAPAAEAFAAHAALLAKRTDVDCVFIATPTHLHRAIAEDALAAGRHVYCEAPLAHTVADAEAIAAAALARNTVFQAGLTARSNPLYKRARALIRSDSVRDVAALYAQDHRKSTWRFPGAGGNWRVDEAVSLGLEGELGSHAIDTMTWFRGRPPKEVRGRGDIRFHDDGRTLPDTVSLELAWDDGVVLQWSGTLASSFGGKHELVHGTMGTLKLADTHGWMFKEADAATQGWEVYATRQQFHRDEGIVLVADATKLAAQGALKEGIGLPFPPVYYALVDFFAAIDSSAQVVAPAADAALAVRVAVAAREAVKTGAAVQI